MAPAGGKTRGRGIPRDAPWLALLVAVVALLFWRVAAPAAADRQMIGPPDGDFARQFVPYRAFVARSWAVLRPPLWNPHQYAGTPAWADPQLAVVYPWRILQVPLALGGRALPLWAVETEALGHILLAGVFSYLLARRLGCGRPAAALAAVTFEAGGYLTGYPKEQLAVVDTAAWIPGLLWTLTAAIGADTSRTAARWSWAAAAAAAMMVMAGHPQTALYGLILAAAWVGARFWRTGRRGVMVATIACGGGAGLSAVAWLPTAALVGRVGRDLDPGALLAGFGPQELAGVVVPHAGGQWWPLWVGALSLGLALWAGARGPGGRFWLAAAAVALLVAVGGRVPGRAAAHETLPGLARFRHHERVAVVWSVALAMAAGLGLEALVQAGAGDRRRGAIALLAAGATALGAALALRSGASAPPWLVDDLTLAALALFGAGGVVAAGVMDGRRPWPGALVLVAALELVTVNHGQGLAHREALYPASGPLPLLPATMPGRVSSEGRLAGGANAATMHGLYDVTGDSPFHLAATEALMSNVPEIVWWQLLDVTHLVTDRTFPDGAPVEALATKEPLAAAPSPGVLREGRLPSPRGYRVKVASAAVWVPGEVGPYTGDEAVDASFDPRSVALVPPEVAAGLQGSAGPEEGGAARATDDEA
ncbi:MAG: hypothetical protein ACE5EL_04465, partial [Anaerolineae bacterium]